MKKENIHDRLFKHKNDRAFVERFSRELFTFVGKHFNDQQKEAYTKALLLYIFQAFKFNRVDFRAFTKKLPKMTGIVSGSLYEQLINEGREEGLEEGLEKGRFINAVIAVRKMTIKKFDVAVIAELLDKKVNEIKKIQKELKQEGRIKTALKKEKAIPEIAKKLKVSEWLVEAIQEIVKPKSKK
ncbi:MAG: hypothetical protein AAGJ18_11930 [Bacteroidota bacterium]